MFSKMHSVMPGHVMLYGTSARSYTLRNFYLLKVNFTVMSPYPVRLTHYISKSQIAFPILCEIRYGYVATDTAMNFVLR
jgi:hypothetical protein